jgi:hypothetical protein
MVEELAFAELPVAVGHAPEAANAKPIWIGNRYPSPSWTPSTTSLFQDGYGTLCRDKETFRARVHRCFWWTVAYAHECDARWNEKV